MSYYNEVAIEMYEKDFNVLDEMAHEMEDRELENLVDSATVTKIGEKAVVLHWDWIKWNDLYTDVSKLMNFLNSCDENGNEVISYKFVRMGEDYSDIEYYNHFLNLDEDEQHLDDIWPQTQISIPEGPSIKRKWEKK